MHNRTVLGNHEIRGSALYFFQNRQTATAGTLLITEYTDIAGPIAYEGKVVGGHMGHHDFSGFASRQRLPLLVNNLNHNIFSGNMHASRRALVGNKPGIPATVSIRDRATKNGLNRVALMVIQAFRGYKRDLDAKPADICISLACVLGDNGQS